MAKTEGTEEKKIRLITSNRRASYDFELTSRFEAGIMLTGTEVKSLRASKCSIQEAFIGFPKNNDEMFIMNMTIPEYAFGNRENHDPLRNRKLLLHEREIRKCKDAVKEKGMTIIPLSVYFSDHLVKVEIALAKAKKKFDKRETTKKKEVERDLKRKYKV